VLLASATQVPQSFINEAILITADVSIHKVANIESIPRARMNKFTILSLTTYGGLFCVY